MNPATSPGAVAVLGVGIRGPGLAGCGAWIRALAGARGPAPGPGPGPGTSALALAAAAEAHAGTGVWDRSRSALFLTVEPGPACPDPAALARLLTQAFGLREPGGVWPAAGSGLEALAAAQAGFRAGTLDSALVGTVTAGPHPLALFLALRRPDLAAAAGGRVWAVLEPGPGGAGPWLRLGLGALLAGTAPAAAGLLQLAAGCVMAAHHVRYSPADRRWEPLLDRSDGIRFELALPEATFHLGRSFRPGPPPRPWLTAPAIAAYAGATQEELIRRLRLDQPGGSGPVRLALVLEARSDRQDHLGRALGLLERAGAGPGWLAAQVCYSPHPLPGRVACLFAPVGGSYPGMGRDLLLGLPALPMGLGSFGDLTPADWLYGAHPERLGDPLYEMAGSMFLSQVHAAFTRDLLGLVPDVAMGLSMGEMNALVAYGAWDSMEGEFDRVRREGIFSRFLAGSHEPARAHWGLPPGADVPWRNWFVTGPVAAVQALAAREPRAYVAMVISPQHCVLAGDAQACARVLAGSRELAAFPVPGFAAHTPVQQRVQDFWRQYYHRPTRPVAGIEFHSGHLGGPYPLSADRVAEALTGAILHPQDFPAMAARAWDRGVRVFVEHGPRNLLTSALKRMLPAEQSLCLALDSPGEPGLLRAVRVAAELWCRGVPVDLERLGAGTGRGQG